jgi:transposase
MRHPKISLYQNYKYPIFYPQILLKTQKFIQWATQRQQAARVCLEATGVYSMPFALALHQAEVIDVMVANPRAIKQFAGASLQRGKTDALDATVTLEYLPRMPFHP